LRIVVLLCFVAMLAGAAHAQAVPAFDAIKSQEELDKAIASLDAALFDAYNRCDVEKFASFMDGKQSSFTCGNTKMAPGR
jgi:hypothetical protein